MLREEGFTLLRQYNYFRQTTKESICGENEGRASHASPTLFNNTVVDAVAWEEEDAETSMTVIRRHEPLHLKEEALAPLPLSALQTAIRELAQDVASLKQEISSFKQDMAHPSKGENPLWRDSNEAQKC